MGTKVLGIETSCDETAAAVVEDGRRLLSNVVASQVEIHARYGGVVPEVASRQHVLAIVPTIRRALEEAGAAPGDLAAVAATRGPGLAGSLLVGLNAAKALAFALGLPLLGVNHLEAHVYAAWLSPPAESSGHTPPSGGARGSTESPEERAGFPLLCVIASGGHTDLLLMEGHGRFRLLGRTRDDAAGEAFDKAARILGLGFPGGPEIQRVAAGDTGAEELPRARLEGSYDFSFSGLKTALLHRAQGAGLYPPTEGDIDGRSGLVREVAAAFQRSVVEVIVAKAVAAARQEGARGILLGGGVTANALLRQEMVARSHLPLFIPAPSLCTDNGAMVAACAFHLLARGMADGPEVDVDPALGLG